MFEWARTVLPCISGEYSSHMILESVKVLGLGALASSTVNTDPMGLVCIMD